MVSPAKFGVLLVDSGYARFFSRFRCSSGEPPADSSSVLAIHSQNFTNEMVAGKDPCMSKVGVTHQARKGPIFTNTNWFAFEDDRINNDSITSASVSPSPDTKPTSADSTGDDQVTAPEHEGTKASLQEQETSQELGDSQAAECSFSGSRETEVCEHDKPLEQVVFRMCNSKGMRKYGKTSSCPVGLRKYGKTSSCSQVYQTISLLECRCSAKFWICLWRLLLDLFGLLIFWFAFPANRSYIVIS
ncbi:hypothetical protein Droror1_Dr00019419 [Drosera rotundifolia]